MIQFSYLFLTGFLAHRIDNWHEQIVLGEMGICYWLAYQIAKKTNYIVGTAFGYFVTCALLTSADSFIFLLLVTLPFLYAKKEDLRLWLRGFQLLSVVNAVFMIFGYIMNGSATGFLGMDSIDGSLLALILPSFVFDGERLNHGYKITAFCLLGLALLLSRSSTVLGILSIEAIVYCYRARKRLLPAILLTLVGCCFLGHQLLNPNGRDTVLKISWRLMHRETAIFGHGAGSFERIIQTVQDTSKPFFTMAHNEPFQVLFEQGIIGLVLLCLVFATMLKKAKDPLLIVVVAAGFQCFFQPCFRYWIFALFLSFLTRLSFENDTNFYIRKGVL